VNTPRERSVSNSPGRAVPGAPQYTRAQLHAAACIVCGRDDCELVPDGHVQMEVRPEQPLTWAVVACPEHRSAA
jgi:hypothetical protein